MTHPDPTENPDTYSVHAYSYPGSGPRQGGWSLHSSKAGTMLVGMPKGWANKAAKLLNSCPTMAEQNAEARRINKAVYARVESEEVAKRADLLAQLDATYGPLAA